MITKEQLDAANATILQWEKEVREGVRAASREVRRLVHPEAVQPDEAMCLLAHGIACPRCKENW